MLLKRRPADAEVRGEALCERLFVIEVDKVGECVVVGDV